jgi:hypothetical protein
VAKSKKTAEDLYKQFPLTKEQETRVVAHFSTEVKKAKANRRDLEARWERAIKLHEGRRDPKNFPTKNASNVNVPMVPTHSAAIHARFMTSLFGQDPLWKVQHRHPDYQDFAEQFTEYLDWGRTEQFPVYRAIRDFSYDAVKLGLGILKLSWLRRRGVELHYDEKFDIVEDEILVEDRPHVESIQPEYFVWADGSTDIQTAPWICHIRPFTPGQLVKRAKSKEIFNLEEALTGARIPFERVEQARDETAGLLPRSSEMITTHELWARYDINDDGVEEEIQLEIEPEGGTVLRCNAIPFFHRRRPFVIGRLEVIEHQIAGLGVADQIGDINEEVNTIHNQLIDAANYSNLSMFKVRPGTPSWDAMEDLYSGKRIPALQDTDVMPMPMGDFKVQALALEQNAHAMAERRTGVSDFSVGREPSASRRGTATGTLAIIQEGNKKFDFQVRDMRDALGEAGLMIASMIDQMNPDGLIQEVLGPDGVAMERLRINFPRDVPLHKAVSVEVLPSSAAVNRQIQRQDAVSLYQLWTNFAQQAAQLGFTVQQMGPISPPLLELIAKLGKGAEVMLSDILVSFENRHKDELIPQLEDIYNEIGAQGAQLAQGIQALGSIGAGSQGGQGVLQQEQGQNPQANQGAPGQAPGGPAPVR